MSIQIPPGASYRTPKAMVVARRHIQHLEDPVRIQFKQEWKEGSLLFDWYQRRACKFIDKIELRREHEAPFHHEFVVFRLGKEGGYFRVDRRQNNPLDFLYKKGIEAYDTIEEVASMDDRLYSPSDCLASLDLRIGIHLSVILRTCWAIQTHPSAWAYTPQRYNSYFFAQTILMCAARSVPEEATFSRIRNTLRFSYDWDNVFARFREHDSDLHVWGIMHEDYCYSHTCHSDIAPPPYACDDCVENVPNIEARKPNTKISGQPRLPIWATTLLLNLKQALAKFWQDAFLSLVGLALPELDETMERIWTDGKGNTQDRLEQLFDTRAYSRRISWGKMCFEQLQPLARRIEPMMKQALRCPVMPLAPVQCSKMDPIKPSQIVKKWAGVMLQFFDSEFERLNSSLKGQVMKIWSTHHELSACPITEDVIEGRQLTSMEIRIKIDSSMHSQVMTLGELTSYHGELVENHARRVDGFNFGVFEEVKSDIMTANDMIWMSVKGDNDCAYCYGLHCSEFSPSVQTEEAAKPKISSAPIWCPSVEQRILEARALIDV